MMIWLRSALFTLLQLSITPLFSVLALLTFPLPPLKRYRIITQWATLFTWLARVILGIRYRVLGAERIPRVPSIVLAKHQSAWETMAFQRIFPPQVWVLKRELLRIPFIGWGLAMTSPIAIDRDAGRQALKQTLQQGRERLDRGFWVVIFPEGTRVAPGTRGKYQIGGAWLAVHTGAPVVPVAHNAGEFWGKNAFLKRPGTITVSIGEPIDPKGMNAQALTARVEAWIEAEMERISGVRSEG
jgi:1-acyl-sn-glycerol-3-phosphate acyltransferase